MCPRIIIIHFTFCILHFAFQISISHPINHIERQEIAMNKEKYTPPELTIVTFEAADIITTSGGAFDGVWVPIGGRIYNEDEEAIHREHIINEKSN